MARDTIRNIVYFLSLSASCLWAGSCVRDDLGTGYDDGAPAQVTLSLVLPEMNEVTRAALSDEDASRVNTLWIGLYDQQSGARKATLYIPDVGQSLNHDMQEVTLNTTAGYTRIVAVANINSNYGVSDHPDMKGDGTLRTLHSLLDEADDWSKFTAISASLTDTANIDRLTPDLVMSGVYYAGESHDSNMDWSEANEDAVYIGAGKVTLPGAIHLRRLSAYVRFNFKAGQTKDGEPVTFEPLSWRVYNIPVLSHLHEQPENASDKSTVLLSRIEDNYGVSNRRVDFTSSGGAHSFDFYVYENKREGREAAVTSYEDREKEFKNSDGTNTGVYMSLCPSVTERENNPGTFVEVEARVSYTAVIEVDGVEQKTPRTGYVTYTIHLGYCEGDTEAEKALDFNCRRNTKYTYNVTVNGLDQIVVEAKRGDETPGVEGGVTDTYEENISLDAHYNVFNIKLSNRERANLDYQLRVPFDGRLYQIYRSQLSDEQLAALKETQFYTWICFKPTSGEDVLARYKDSETDESQLYLEDLRDVANHPGYNGSTDENDDTQQYYTVFVDEYVYEKDADGNSLVVNGRETQWWKYVEQQDRVAYIRLSGMDVSLDGESYYVSSKYSISQKSIQTYYTTDGSSATALGVEHENESYGLNLISNSSMVQNEPANSRYNVWRYLTENGTKSSYDWSDWVSETVPEVQPAINKTLGSITVTSPRTTRTVYGLRPMYTINASSLQPTSSSSHYEVLTACLNRNRDTNGNGKIDVEELKWFVPSVNKYVQIVLGRRALVNPLISLSNLASDGRKAGSREEMAPLHYVSSEGICLWAEEGMSFGDNIGKGPDVSWQVRCVRALGIDQREIENDEVEMAYTYDEATRTITMAYYDVANIRATVAMGIPAHTIDAMQNQPAEAFMYAKEDCYNLTNASGISMSGYDITNWSIPNWVASLDANTICGQYHEDGDGGAVWRVPNQKELTILRRLADLEGIGLDVSDVGTGSMRGWLSCSREYFSGEEGNRFAFVIYNNDVSNPYWRNTMGYDSRAQNRVRCVRDTPPQHLSD